MKRFFTGTLSLMTVCVASVAGVINSPAGKNMEVRKVGENNWSYTTRNVVSRSSETTKTVEFKPLLENFPDLLCNTVFMVDENNQVYFAYADPYGDFPIEIECPAGKYDIVFEFINYPDPFKAFYPSEWFWIKEGVDIDGGEKTEITVDPAEIKNHIKCRSYRPDGQPWILPVDTDGMGASEGESNVSSIVYTTQIYIDGLRETLAGFGGNVVNRYVAFDEWQDQFDFYTTDCSEKFIFVQELYITDSDIKNQYNDVFVLRGSNAGDVIHDGKDYILYQEEMRYPVRPPKNGMGVLVGGSDTDTAVFGDGMNGWIFQGSLIADENGMANVWKWQNADGTEDTHEVVTMYTATLAEPFITDDDARGYHPIIGAHCNFTRSGKEYLHPYSIETYIPQLYVPQEGMKEIQYYPGHEGLKYDESQKLDVFGNSIPMVMLKSEYYAPKNDLSIAIKTYGRLGDQYQNTYPFLTWKGKVDNGAEITGVYDDLKMICRGANIQKNRYDLELEIPYSIIDNDGNDFAGFNNTKITMLPGSGDGNMPTFRMLQFRDKDGNVTDRFNSPDGASLMTVVSDWKKIDTHLYSLDRPKIIEISYSPLDKNEWELLELQDVPEYHYYNFGYTLKSDLSDIVRNSESGWFDLNMVVEDAEGNRIEQTISPAFFVESLASVGNMAVDTYDSVDVFTLNGIRVAESVSPAEFTGTPGVYIMRSRTSGKVSKVIVK